MSAVRHMERSPLRACCEPVFLKEEIRRELERPA